MKLCQSASVRRPFLQIHRLAIGAGNAKRQERQDHLPNYKPAHCGNAAVLILGRGACSSGVDDNCSTAVTQTEFDEVYTSAQWFITLESGVDVWNIRSTTKIVG